MATYHELKENLHSKNIQTLYLLLGPEEFLARELTSLIIETALGDGMRDFNFIELDTPTADPPTLFQELNAYPLGSDRRVVLIRDAGSLPAATQDALREAAADLPDFLTLIITAERMDKRKALYKTLAKAGVTVDLQPLRPAEAKAWIRRRLKARGKHASPQLIDHIFALTGTNLSEISNEIDNLVAYMGDNNAVTQSEIDTLVSSRQKEPVYRLTESVADGNFMEAITILHQLLAEGEHELRILWHLDFLVKRFLRAKSLQEEGVRESDIMKALRIQPFLRERFFRQVRSFSLDELRSMYRVIVEWDNKFKSTSRWHPDIDMELLVRKLCVTQER
jgi:DNA polymerase-3 subunit delta